LRGVLNVGSKDVHVHPAYHKFQTLADLDIFLKQPSLNISSNESKLAANSMEREITIYNDIKSNYKLTGMTDYIKSVGTPDLNMNVTGNSFTKVSLLKTS
jgi:hypothetical protein